jgi:5'-nucleotidase
VPWQTVETHAPDVLRKLIKLDLPRDTFLNVNFPNCQPDEVKGTSVVSQGKYVHSLHIEERQDGRDIPYYWVRFQNSKPSRQPGTDIEAIEENRIAISPLKMNLTDFDTFDQLSKSMSKDA